MKTLITAVAIALLANFAKADQLALIVIKQPLYLHESDGDPAIHIYDVPVAYASASPESLYQAIHLPFVPSTDGSWPKPSNVNVTSIYGIRISVKETETEPVLEYTVTIDASKAKQPEGYPFTIEQVIEATTTCVRAMTPTVPESTTRIKIEVKRPEKDKK